MDWRTRPLLGIGDPTYAGYQDTAGSLARAMAAKNYQIGQPMTNLVAPSTLSTQVPQPMTNIDFSHTPNVGTLESQGVSNPNPGVLPSSTVVGQTGQGGGQSTNPGSANGQPTQAGGSGSSQVTPTPSTPSATPWGVNPATWARDQANIASIPDALRTTKNAEPYLDYMAANGPGSVDVGSLAAGSPGMNPIQGSGLHAAWRDPNSIAPPPDDPTSSIRQHQIAMGLIRPDGSTAAGDAYKSWLMAGRPDTNAQGQQYTPWGGVMSANAWDPMNAMLQQQGGSPTPTPTGGTISPAGPTVHPLSSAAHSTSGVIDGGSSISPQVPSRTVNLRRGY